MPLSPDEQRILAEIELHLSAEDSEFARVIGDSTLQRHLVRRIRGAAAGFVIGFVALMSFPVSIVLAAVGFGVMLAASLIAYRAIVSLGREQVAALRRSGRLSLTGLLARAVERIRGDGR